MTPAPLHARGVDRPELRQDPTDPTTLPTDRLELYFILRKELKHLLEISHTVLMTSAGARDGARVLARAAHRFARTAEAFADQDPKEEGSLSRGPVSGPHDRSGTPSQAGQAIASVAHKSDV